MSNLTGKEAVKTAFTQLHSVDFLKSGAYCNLSAMAKPFGKRVDKWMKLKRTQKLFQAFRDDPCYGGAEPVVTRKGGYKPYIPGLSDVPDRGTFAHPDIAILFASWCDPRFALWMSRQIRIMMSSRQGQLVPRELEAEAISENDELNRHDIKDLHD